MTLYHNNGDILFPVLDLGAFSFLVCYAQFLIVQRIRIDLQLLLLRLLQ